MKKLLIPVALVLLAGAALAAATVGQPAPSFTVQDTTGKAVSLADYKGKTVVLEWVNPGCPYVQKHYSAANMQGAQKDAANATLMGSDGKLVYAGGIDNKASANQADIAGATNHVKVALGDLQAGKAVSQPTTRPYGCSVKYSSM